MKENNHDKNNRNDRITTFTHKRPTSICIILRESHIHLSWYSRGSSLLVELQLGDVGLCGEEGNGRNASAQGENQQ